MYENQVSKKTKKDNMVKTRTQEFQQYLTFYLVTTEHLCTEWENLLQWIPSLEMYAISNIALYLQTYQRIITKENTKKSCFKFHAQ